jgi:folate-binding protein YgfZ
MSSAAELYHDSRARGGVVDLSDRVKLSFTGADRVRYLNGQVTSNVTKLPAGQTQPACVTTAKGRLCAEVMITAVHNALFVDADASLLEVLPARLERYIIADDVTLSACPGQTRLFHFLGDKPTWLMSDAEPGSLPALPAAMRFGRAGWDWWTDDATAAQYWPEITNRVVVLDESLAELLRIEAGIPRWGFELGEDTLPPEAGLDRTHIDYHKGCYIGQEVISRLKSIGHVNRHLTGFLATAGTALSPGTALFAPGDDARPVGLLTSTAYSFALEKPIALGYLKRGSPTGNLLARTADAPGAVVTIRALPFLS